MITPGEVKSTTDALAAALQAVEAAERAAANVRNLLSYAGVEDAVTRNARETAEGARRLYSELVKRRNAIVELLDYDHEGVLEIVSLANNLVRRNTAGSIAKMAASNDPIRGAAEVARGVAGDAVKAVAGSRGAWELAFKALPWLGLAAAIAAGVYVVRRVVP